MIKKKNNTLSSLEEAEKKYIYYACNLDLMLKNDQVLFKKLNIHEELLLDWTDKYINSNLDKANVYLKEPKIYDNILKQVTLINLLSIPENQTIEGINKIFDFLVKFKEFTGLTFLEGIYVDKSIAHFWSNFINVAGRVKPSNKSEYEFIGLIPMTFNKHYDTLYNQLCHYLLDMISLYGIFNQPKIMEFYEFCSRYNLEDMKTEIKKEVERNKEIYQIYQVSNDFIFKWFIEFLIIKEN